MRTAPLALLLAVLLGALGLAHEATRPTVASELPRKCWTAWSRAAGSLAKDADGEGATLLLELGAALGAPEKDQEKLGSSIERSLERARSSAKTHARAQVDLQALGLALEGALEGLDDERAREVATWALRIDGSLAGAHQRLGHAQVGERWLDEAQAARARSEQEVNRWIQRARRLLPELRVERATLAGLTDDDPARLTRVSLGGLALEGPLPEARLRRMLTSIARALALSRALRGGGLLFEPLETPATLFVCGSEDSYRAAIAGRHARGALDDRMWADFQRLGWTDMPLDGPDRIFAPRAEQHLLAALTVWAWRAQNGFGHQACLESGHLNWLCMSLLGSALPSFAWQQELAGSDRTRAGGKAARDWTWEAARFTTTGCLEWIRMALSEGRCPPWARSVVTQVGELSDEALLLATAASEHLHLTRELGPLMERTKNEPAALGVIEEALGRAMGDVDAELREWLAGAAPGEGLVQRRSRGPEVAPAGLAHLQDLRIRALGGDAPDLHLLPALSRGCEGHCAYLEAHEELWSEWPEVHEEDPLDERSSPGGSWAGAHGVIAFTGDAEAAVEQWMGTFFHRLPLLDPGLRAVGLASSERITVLDCTSVVLPSPRSVLWPEDGATEVPLRFVPELPNPVPGEDQAEFGYPITLQVSGSVLADGPTRLLLLAGEEEIPCWVITPTAPLFEELAPAGAFALIPKQPLSPRTRYTVVVEGPFSRRTSFTTAGR